MKLFLLITILASIGCRTATKYHEFQDGDGGYYSKKMGPGHYFVGFIGNSKTSKDIAADYAIKRGAELCLAESFKFFDVFDPVDLTRTYTDYDTSTAIIPVGKMAVAQSTTTPVNYQYPNIGFSVLCYENSQKIGFGITMEGVSSDKAAVAGIKDLLGAVLVVASTNGKLEVGDVIYKVNGQRVVTPTVLAKTVRDIGKNNMSIELYRNGILKSVEIITTTIPVSMKVVDHVAGK